MIMYVITKITKYEAKRYITWLSMVWLMYRELDTFLHLFYYKLLPLLGCIKDIHSRGHHKFVGINQL